MTGPTLKLATDLTLPVEAVTEAIGFLGRRGSGKSYAAQKLAEEMYRAKAQFVALDPVGNWSGLRLAANGTEPGIPIPVFGGLQGDVPIEPTAGNLLADTIVDRGISAVIDVSQFESDAAKARFARAFCERFYFRKKSAPSAVHVFLEEAQEFIPQNPTKDEPQMLHAFTRLAKLGRNFGIGLSMISQRPQEVHKKVLNLAELLLVFQLTGVHERKAVESWIGDKGLDEDIDQELPKLEQGRPHAWSPGWLKISRVVSIGRKWTFDASSTPKVGAQVRPVRELSPIDLEKLRTDMASSIERAKADDPKELRKEISSLRAQLTKAQRGVSVPGQVERIDPGAISRAVAAAVEKQDRSMRVVFDRRGKVLGQIAAGLDKAATLLTQSALDLRHVQQLPAPEASNGHPPVSDRGGITKAYTSPGSARSVPVPASRDRGAQEDGAASLGRTPRRMIDAMAQLSALGVTEPSRENVAGWVGISANTGTFRNYLSDLRTAGAIDDLADGRLRLTAHGLSLSSGDAPIDSLETLHAIWRSRLGRTPGQMMDVLIQAYPESVSRAALAQAVGISHETGTFRNYLSDLRSPGILRDVSKTEVAASDLLFPPGLS